MWRDPFEPSRQLQGFDGRWQRDAPLAPRTHIRIGGRCDWLVEPASETDVVRVVRACRERGLALRVLGGGSNLLVDDAGLDGVVMSLARLDRVVRDGPRVRSGAGVPLPRLLRLTRQAGLAGLETLAGIPAQVGGAVAMNAGTRAGETFDRLVTLTVVDPQGELRLLRRDALRPRYRDGGLGAALVLAAEFELQPDDPEAIAMRFEDLLAERNATQPVSERSLGCVFRNPPGDAAARLIERAGCKGMACGSIRVSEKHANFFLNEGGGTAADFQALMEAVRGRVRFEFGVDLQPEIRHWVRGRSGDAAAFTNLCRRA